MSTNSFLSDVMAGRGFLLRERGRERERERKRDRKREREREREMELTNKLRT